MSMAWLNTILNTLTPLTVGIAIIGAGIGAAIGHQFMHLNRNSTSLCAIVGSVLFWIAWRILLVVASLVVIVSAAWWIIRHYARIRQELLELASLLNLLPDPSRDPHHFDDRLAELADEHDDRLDSIRWLGDDDDFTERLTELENNRFRDRLRDLFGDDLE